MKEILEIAVPTDWEEVSINKYVKYCDAVKDLEDEEEIMKMTISVLCDIPVNLIHHIQLKDLKVIHKHLQKLVSKPVNKTIISKININNKMFGFHPKLDELTMGEFVDVETFSKENDLAKMMSVLYRPIIKEQGNRYDIEPYHTDHLDNVKYFKDLSINVANPIAVFFWNLGNEQSKTTLQYLKEAEKNQQQTDMVGLQ